MNKKLFALLLLVPMLIFATDQVLGSIGPEGGKDKKKKKADTEAQAAPATDIGQVAAQGSNVEAGTPLHTESSRSALANSHSGAERLEVLQKYFADLDGTRMKYDEKDFGEYDDDVLNAKTIKLLEHKLLRVVRKMDPTGIDSEDWFSRCPSGYFYTVNGDKEGKPLATGTLGQHRGCSRYALGKFRYNIASNKVSMKLPKKMGYVSVTEYFKLWKEVMG